MIIQPSALPDLPSAVLDAARRSPVSIRKGRLVARYVDRVLVDVGGGLFRASYLASYEPMVGDIVMMVRQDGTWLVLGTFGTPAGETTAVANYNFERGTVGVTPPNWQLVTTSGSPTFTTDTWTRSDYIDGTQVGRLGAAATGTIACDLVSDVIAVQPGESWAVSAHVATDTNFLAGTACAIAVYAAWYSDSSLGSLISQDSSGLYAVTRGMPWRQVRSMGTGQGWPVPGTAHWLRVKIGVSFTVTNTNDRFYIDRVLARRA